MSKRTDAELAREWADELTGYESAFVNRFQLLRRLAAQSEALRELVEAEESLDFSYEDALMKAKEALKDG